MGRTIDLLPPASAFGDALAHAADAEATPFALKLPAFVAGRWYDPLAGAAPLAGANIGTANTRLFPFVLDRPFEVASLGTRVTTLGAGNARLGIYASNPATLEATGAALAQGTVSTAAASDVAVALGASVELPAGLYWGAAQVDNATALLQVTNGNPSGRLAGSSTLAGLSSSATGVLTGRTVAVGYAAGLPDMTAQVFANLATTSWGRIFLLHA